MVEVVPDDEDLLKLLSHFSQSWTDLLKQNAEADTRSILRSVTAEAGNDLREILSRIDVEIRHQAQNAAAGT
ncbi:MAG: hypothetical protein KDA96_26025, partial [Planctomycetaceae bacterium]|nr:hypothetical protein [Planctomycetaceae bacterium]